MCTLWPLIGWETNECQQGLLLCPVSHTIFVCIILFLPFHPLPIKQETERTLGIKLLPVWVMTERILQLLKAKAKGHICYQPGRRDHKETACFLLLACRKGCECVCVCVCVCVWMIKNSHTQEMTLSSFITGIGCRVVWESWSNSKTQAKIQCMCNSFWTWLLKLWSPLSVLRQSKGQWTFLLLLSRDPWFVDCHFHRDLDLAIQNSPWGCDTKWKKPVTKDFNEPRGAVRFTERK
jgi:hypothetical protein